MPSNLQILDTDTLSHLHTGNQNVIRVMQQLTDAEVGTTIVTKIEMLRGRIDYILKAQVGEDLLKAQQRFHRTEELLAQIPIFAITEGAIEHLVTLVNNSKLRKIGRADLIIASIALSHRATLVTRNLRHFRQISALTVINWVD
jgi:tRNA(fMet)-specific endonuclease VapC